MNADTGASTCNGDREMDDRYYTPKEAAEFLGVSVWTLARWRTECRGPVFLKLGKSKTSPVRYERECLIHYASIYGPYVAEDGA